MFTPEDDSVANMPIAELENLQEEIFGALKLNVHKGQKTVEAVQDLEV